MNSRRAFLIGTPFSGSTVFGQALGAAQGVRYLGEIDRLVRFPPDLRRDEPDVTCNYCQLLEQPCPVWTDERVAQARRTPIGELMNFFESEFDGDVLVDGSKHLHWLRAVADDGGIELGETVLFLTTRSPFGFVDSHQARIASPTWEAANIWRDVSDQALRLSTKLNLPLMVVRYEDFAREPEPLLHSASCLLGIPYQPEMRFFQHIPSHDVGGNFNARTAQNLDSLEALRRIPEQWRPAAMEEYWGRPFGGWVDLKWQRRLDASDVETITQTPGLSGLAALLGYDLGREISAWEAVRISEGLN